MPGTQQGGASNNDYTAVKMPGGGIKYYPSSLGEAKIREMALSGSGGEAFAPKPGASAAPPARGASGPPTREQATDPSLWQKANTPLVSPDQIHKAAGDPTDAEAHATTEKAIAKGESNGAPEFPNLPEKYNIRGLAEGAASLFTSNAARKAYEEGVSKGVAEFVSSWTSPLQIGLTVASGGASGASALAKFAPEAKALATLAKVSGAVSGTAGTAAVVAFGAQGIKDAVTPKKEGETDADAMERRLFGVSAVAGSLGGGLATVKDTAHGVMRRQLGLNEDLAKKVADQNARIATERATATQQKTEVNEQTQKRVDSITQSLDQEIGKIQTDTSLQKIDITKRAERALNQVGDKLSEIEKQKVRETAQIVADSTLQADIEQARVKAPFEDIGKQIESPISTTGGIRDIVVQAFKDHGVKESEIPSGALKALGKAPAASDAVSPDASSLKNNPEFAAAQSAARGESSVSFNDATRIREDLWQSARTPDERVNSALKFARQKVSELQEAAAKKAGLSDRYEKAKNDFRDFKRGIGSGLMNDFLSQIDAQEQAMIPKLRKILNPNTAEAMRTILNAMEIDTKPLTELLQAERDVKRVGREIPRARAEGVKAIEKRGTAAERDARGRAGTELTEARRQGRNAEREIEGQSKTNIKRIRAEGSPVPGREVEELAGKTQEQLEEERVRSLLSKAKEGGMNSVGALVWTVFGLMRMAAGSPLGGITAMRGVSSMELPQIVRDPRFQDWIIRKSGVEPRSKLGLKMSLGLSRLYPLFRKLAQSGQLSGAAENTAQPPTREQATSK